MMSFGLLLSSSFFMKQERKDKMNDHAYLRGHACKYVGFDNVLGLAGRVQLKHVSSETNAKSTYTPVLAVVREERDPGAVAGATAAGPRRRRQPRRHPAAEQQPHEEAGGAQHEHRLRRHRPRPRGLLLRLRLPLAQCLDSDCQQTNTRMKRCIYPGFV